MFEDISFRTTSADLGDFSSLAVEVWRLERKLSNIQCILGNDNTKSLFTSLDKIKLFLEKNKIEVTDFTGQKYDDGLNVDVLSFLKGQGGGPTIIETIEPMIKYDGRIVKRAKVIVEK